VLKHVFIILLIACSTSWSAEDGSISDLVSDPIPTYAFGDDTQRSLDSFSGHMLAVWGMCKSCGDQTPENFAAIRAAVDRRNREHLPIVLIVLATDESKASAQEGLAAAGVTLDQATGIMLATGPYKGPQLRRQSAVYDALGQPTLLRFKDIATAPADQLPTPTK